jgi:hypothetical protein
MAESLKLPLQAWIQAGSAACGAPHAADAPALSPEPSGCFAPLLSTFARPTMRGAPVFKPDTVEPGQPLHQPLRDALGVVEPGRARAVQLDHSGRRVHVTHLGVHRYACEGVCVVYMLLVCLEQGSLGMIPFTSSRPLGL